MHAARSSINRETPEIVFKSIFKRYDEDNNGHLDLNEFSNALDDLGIIDHYEQRALFALADADNSQTIEYEEFLNLIQGHDFEYLLSNREDYLFVIETFKTFEDYDQDKDGAVTWGEFYAYLSAHGYSHEYISQYWHYMDNNQTKQITFSEFWIGFKTQAQALRQKELYEQMTQQFIGSVAKSKTIDSDDEEDSFYTNRKPLNKYRSSAKLLGGKNHQRIKSLFGNDSTDQMDKNNIFRVMKRHLKRTKTKSRNGVRLGKVIDDESNSNSDDANGDFVIVSDSGSESDEIDSIAPLRQKVKSHEIHFRDGDVLSTLSPKMKKSISLDTPILDKGWNKKNNLESDEESDSHSMSLDILSEHEEDEKINENVIKLSSSTTKQQTKGDIDDMKVQNDDYLLQDIDPLVLSNSDSDDDNERRSSVIIHKSDSDEIKVSEAAAIVSSEINESANQNFVKSVFIKRKSKKQRKNKKKKAKIVKKRASTPNIVSSKSVKVKGTNRKKTSKKLTKKQPILASASSLEIKRKSNDLIVGSPSALMQKKLKKKHQNAKSENCEKNDHLNVVISEIANGQNIKRRKEKKRKIKRRSSLDLSLDKNKNKKKIQKKTTPKANKSKTEKKKKSKKHIIKIEKAKKRITVPGNKVTATLKKAKRGKKEFEKNKVAKVQKVKKVRRSKKKSDYTSRDSVGAGFDLFQNYRVKAKKKRQIEKNKKVQQNPFEIVLRERKMSLSKTSKKQKRKSKKAENKLEAISENKKKSNQNRGPSMVYTDDEKEEKEQKSPKKGTKKKKHKRNNTKHGSLELMKITRDIGHLDIGKVEKKKKKKHKKRIRHNQTIDAVPSKKKKEQKLLKYSDNANLDSIIESIQNEQSGKMKNKMIKKKGPSKLKMQRARSNEFESKILSKTSPKISPRQLPKKRSKKIKKMQNLKLSGDDLPKRSKSSIHLQTKKKLKKKTKKNEVLSVGNWLQQIGLSQYEQMFVDNGFDNMLFVKNIKNEQILKQMGMSKIGHTNHIIAEIQKLNEMDQQKKKLNVVEAVYD